MDFSQTLEQANEGHLVQFYDDEEFLSDVIARFLSAGFEAGEPAVVIATEEHRASVDARLRARGLDVKLAIGSGHLVMLDARSTLERFMVEGMPDWTLFQSVIGQSLKGCARLSSNTRVRAYGEMVDLLWRDRNPRGAIALEQQWNELSKRHAFTLLCAYAMGRFRTEADAETFQAICSAHSHVFPTEKYSLAESLEARLRQVSLLQQRASALESEVERRKHVEQALLEALSVRDDFLSVAGHELKTPLTALMLHIHSLETMAKELESPKLHQQLNRARRQTDRLQVLINELLDVSRINAGRLSLQLEGCDLSALVQEVTDRSQESAERYGSALSVSVSGPVVGLWDRMRLEQVVTNLLTNALKYGRGLPVELCVEADQDRARLTVTDQGLGVPLEDQARIFDRFERAASARHFGGLGLGLWIVRQIVEAHRGVVRVVSGADGGSTFTVELPFR
jgi:signal transduction histidine kinase